MSSPKHMSTSVCEVYDVVVVGAGVEGSSTAYHLASQRPRKKILLLEQVSVVSGTSPIEIVPHSLYVHGAPSSSLRGDVLYSVVVKTECVHSFHPGILSCCTAM